jgi:hypothetical protein
VSESAFSKEELFIIGLQGDSKLHQMPGGGGGGRRAANYTTSCNSQCTFLCLVFQAYIYPVRSQTFLFSLLASSSVSPIANPSFNM